MSLDTICVIITIIADRIQLKIHRIMNFTTRENRQLTLNLIPDLLQIADFGLSNLYHGDQYLQTFCGSPLYASPEIVNGRPYRGPEVDTWSLGVLLYALVHGAMPFDGNDHKTLVQQISTGNYRKPMNPSGESFCRDRLVVVI